MPSKIIIPVAIAFAVLVAGAGFALFKVRSKPTTTRALFATTSLGTAEPLLAPLRVGDPVEKWTHDPSAPVRQAQVAGDRLVLLEASDKDATLAVVSLSEGKTIWEKDLDSEFSGSINVVGNTAVLVGSEVSANSSTGRAVAYDLSSQNELWHKDFDGSSAFVLGQTDGLIVVAGGDSKSTDVKAIDPVSGEEKLKKNFAPQSMFVGQKTLYVLEDETISAYDLSNSEKRWSTSASKTATMVEMASTLLVAPGDDPGEVIAYGLEDGKKQWNTSVKSDDISGLARLSDEVAIVKIGDRLVAISTTEKGSQKWTTSLLNGATTVGPEMIVGIAPDDTSSTSSTDRSDRLVTFDTAKGEKQTTVNTKQAITGVAYAEGVSYLYDSSANRFVAHDLASGEKLWTFNPKDEAAKAEGNKGVLPVDGGVVVVTNKDVRRLGS